MLAAAGTLRVVRASWDKGPSSVHGIFQARVKEWGAIAFSTYGHKNCLIHRHGIPPSIAYDLCWVIPVKVVWGWPVVMG